ncbi:hypothetical protein ABKV19_016458 [Rosa sericea]
MASSFSPWRIVRDLADIPYFQTATWLVWCAENKSRLKKSKSKLEFQLRPQEFIELVRAENNLRAITYAQKYLAPW